MYNVDEKGFLVGIGIKMRRIMSREAYEKGRCRQATHDGNREFLTLIACISALGIAIPPVLLYKGSSRDLQDTWVEDLREKDLFHFASTENGWTNDAYGMEWLKTVFEPLTRPKRATTKRLLIVDGHSSHVNLAFIEYASRHGIIILILPPHSTHRLQPLDLNCFLPLGTKYGVHLNEWFHKSFGQVSMTKRTFLPIFRLAWEESFTKDNIQGGFRKAGIWPFSPPIVLNTIKRRPETPPDAEDESIKPPPTPMTSKSIRRAQKAYKANPTKDNLSLILRSQERLAAQHEIDQHIQRGLFETIKTEKQRRQRGKRLNLVGEENTGAQIFPPSQVRAALDYAAAKKAEAEAEKAAKAAKKAQAAENKQKKKAEAQEKALQRQVERETKAQTKAEEKAAKEAQKKQSTLQKKNEKKSLIVVLPLKSTSRSSTKAVTFAEHIEVVVEEEGSQMTSTTGRKIKLPQRFRT
jgi:Skp family chaperone for outer membrane proteins